MAENMPKRIDGFCWRIVSVICAVLLLLSGAALTSPARALDTNPATGTVSLYRWDKITDVAAYAKSLSGWTMQPLLLTWSDNGKHYFAMEPTKYRTTKTPDTWSWSGSNQNGTLLLRNTPVSTQPRMNEMLSAGCDTFFSTDLMGVGLRVSRAYDDLVELYAGYVPGTSDTGIALRFFYNNGYEDHGQSLWKPRDDYLTGSAWQFQNSGSGMRIGGSTNNPKTYLRHSNNGIFANIEGITSTQFDKPYAATEIKISSIQNDYTVGDGEVTHLDASGCYLSPGKTLTVAKGGVLSIGGTVLNDGKIVVEKGGILLLKQGATIMPFSPSDANRGGIICSGGTIIVKKDAKIIGGGATGFYVSGGLVDNFGLIASENVSLENSRVLENHKGAFLFLGRTLSHSQLQNCMAANLSKKAYENSSITKDNVTTVLSGGTVYVEEGAIIESGGETHNFGSFGSGANTSSDPAVYVYTRETVSSSWSKALATTKSKVGYYQSEPMYVTYREYLEKTGLAAPLHRQYGSGEEFETQLAAYCAANGVDSPDAACTVYDGVFTVDGKVALTVPWYMYLRVSEGGNPLLPDGSLSWNTKAVWGDGARPANAASKFDGAPFASGTLFSSVEPAGTSGLVMQVRERGFAENSVVETGVASVIEPHQEWRLELGDVGYQNGQKYCYYYVTSLSAGMALTQTGGVTPSEGEGVVLQSKRDLTQSWTQLWRLEKTETASAEVDGFFKLGDYRLIPRADDELCLTASGADEALALQRSADANASQLWRFGTAPDEYTAYAQFPFQLEPKCAPGMRLQIKDGSNYYGAKHTALIEEASGAKYQNMYFDFAEFTYEDGQWCCWYYIRPANSNNNVLATHSNSSVAGTDVHLYYKSQTFIKSIEWRVEYLDEGYCRLIPRANRNVALNVAGSGSVAGANVNVQTIDNSAGQSWRLLNT